VVEEERSRVQSSIVRGRGVELKEFRSGRFEKPREQWSGEKVQEFEIQKVK
jgi:hypothetical protein